jgi:hypothetical protein
MFKRRWKLAVVAGVMAALSFGGWLAGSADAAPPAVQAACPSERLNLDIGLHTALANAFAEPDEALDYRRLRR